MQYLVKDEKTGRYYTMCVNGNNMEESTIHWFWFRQWNDWYVFTISVYSNNIFAFSVWYSTVVNVLLFLMLYCYLCIHCRVSDRQLWNKLLLVLLYVHMGFVWIILEYSTVKIMHIKYESRIDRIPVALVLFPSTAWTPNLRSCGDQGLGKLLHTQ